MKHHQIRSLGFWAIAIAVVWSVAQFLLVYVFADMPIATDAIYVYDTQARWHASMGTIYPTSHNLNDIYLQAPGYVNYLALIYCLFGTYKPVLVLNAIMNIVVLVEMFYLARRFFNKRTALVSIVLYCLILTNLFAPIHVLTEVPYLFFALTAFCLSLSEKWYVVLFAGFIYAFAHTIRPIVLAFIVCTIVYYVVRRNGKWKYVALLAPIFTVLMSYGSYVKQQTGYFYTSSSITGFDLMFTAHDGADGGQDMSIWAEKDGPSYIENGENVHFAVKDSIRKERAIKWIKQHPMRYVFLCIKRVPLMFRNDSWSIPKLSPYDDIKDVMKMPNPQRAHLVLYLRQALYSAVFYLVVLLFAVSLVRNRSEILSSKGLFVLLFVLGVAGTCLLGMQARYHHPYVFIMVMWASYELSKWPWLRKIWPE